MCHWGTRSHGRTCEWMSQTKLIAIGEGWNRNSPGGSERQQECQNIIDSLARAAVRQTPGMWCGREPADARSLRRIVRIEAELQFPIRAPPLLIIPVVVAAV